MRARQLGTFCTALYGTLERTDGAITFTFASAGHPLPILDRVGVVSTIGEPGGLAGVFDHIEPKPTSLALQAGDAVVLYTDGVTDVAPPHGLTPAEFEAIVHRCAERTQSAEEMAEQIHLELSRILPIEQRHDDIALLVLRVLADPSPSPASP